MALRTEAEFLAAPDALKKTRQITSTGTVKNFNIDTNLPVQYVDHLGKITKMYIESQSAFDKKFPSGEAALIDSEATANSEKLAASTQKALKNSNDACAAAGSLGGLSATLKDVGKELEEASGAILGAVAEVAGVVNEALSAVGQAVAELTSLIAEAVGLVAALIAAGINELAELIDAAINEATTFVETALNAINEAVGEVAGAIADTVDSAIDAVGEAIGAAASLVSDVVAAVAAGGCKETTGILTSLPVVPAGPAGAIQSKIKGTVPQQSRMLKSDNVIVNFNIDKSLPYRDIKYRGKLTRMYYQDASVMNDRFPIVVEGSS